MDIREATNQLDMLRKRWAEEKDKRPIIELQARALQCAIDLYYRKHPQVELTETPSQA